MHLVRFEPVTSRSEIGTSHVTDGWKLSFILNLIYEYVQGLPDR